MKNIVLFTQENSIYSHLGCKCYGKKENALTYTGSMPVIAHPPCRAWGKLKGQAKPEPGEKELSLFAMDIVNKNGGILEHPKASDLFRIADTSKGFLYPIQQKDYGHVARKDTYLYIVGIEIKQLPKPRIILGKEIGKLQDLPRRQREHTPVDLALYLIEILGVIQDETLQNEKAEQSS